MDQELHTELVSINGKLSQLLTLYDIVSHHDQTLFGNGKPGIVVEIDRLVQQQKQHKYFYGLGITAIFGAFSTKIGELFHKLFS